MTRAPRKRPEPSPTTPDPIDIAMEAESGDIAPDSPARRVLLKHERLIGWQIARERTAVGLNLMVGLGGIAVAVALGVMVWQASQARGLVVEAFSAPPELAARGLTGQAVAAQVLDKLSVMQAQTAAARTALTSQSSSTDDLTLEIPQTGVSLGEVNRYLRRWLGHETHVSGEVFRTATGLTVTTRAGSQAGDPVSGADADLDKLLQTTAEAIYRRTQPYRYVFYLKGQKRTEEAIAILFEMAEGPMGEDRAWADTEVFRILAARGDMAGAQALADESVRLLPDDPYIAVRYKNFSGNAGHDEATLRAAERAAKLIRRHPDAMTAAARDQYQLQVQTDLAELRGDLLRGARLEGQESRLPEFDNGSAGAATWVYRDLALAHDAAGADAALTRARGMKVKDVDLSQQLLVAQVALGRWSAAVETGTALKATADQPPPSGTGSFVPGLPRPLFDRSSMPLFAYATAMNGDIPAAEGLIASTPLDCDNCVRVRGQIAALKGDRRTAEHWFSEAVRIGPSLPFAYLEWGKLLLDSGDPGAAIAKFKLANMRGPRFADPLEGWGEALMAQGDFKGAVVKFREADRYAPKWDRLHLKWSEALGRLGKAEEAHAQAAMAASLKAKL